MAVEKQEGGGITGFIVSELRRIRGESLPEDVVRVARHCLLDWMGVTVAGAGEPLVLRLLEDTRDDGGRPACTVVWHGERVSVLQGALINASASDALDFSDSNPAMRGQSTPAVIGAALAMAEARNAPGLELLAAIVAGIESECRVGLLVNNSLRPGFHPTGNLAPFGAAAAAAHLLKLDAIQYAQALGIVATQAAGLHNAGGTMSKPFHSGKAAMNGVQAARLASRGFIGRPDAIEAPQGFLDTHGAGRKEEQALYDAAGRYLISDTAFKMHAACSLTHPTIENMLDIRRRLLPGAAPVKRIEIKVPSRHLRVCNIQEPVSALEAKFSLRATAAMTLLGDDTTDINAYEPARVTRKELVTLRDCAQVEGRDDIGSDSVTIVELADGQRLEARHGERRPPPLDAQEAMLVRKFMQLTTPLLGEQGAIRLRDQILDLHRAPTLGPLLKATMQPATAAARVA